MQMLPLYWLILGIALLFVELLTPGFVAMFFGMAAITVALLDWLLPLGQIAPWIIFAVLSVVYILLLRKLLKRAAQITTRLATSSDRPSTFELNSIARTVTVI